MSIPETPSSPENPPNEAAQASPRLSVNQLKQSIHTVHDEQWRTDKRRNAKPSVSASLQQIFDPRHKESQPTVLTIKIKSGTPSALFLITLKGPAHFKKELPSWGILIKAFFASCLSDVHWVRVSVCLSRPPMGSLSFSGKSKRVTRLAPPWFPTLTP
jgi:hypothetical protein